MLETEKCHLPQLHYKPRSALKDSLLKNRKKPGLNHEPASSILADLISPVAPREQHFSLGHTVPLSPVSEGLTLNPEVETMSRTWGHGTSHQVEKYQ